MNFRGAKSKPPHLYTDLAPWFHLPTAPEDYKAESDFYTSVLEESSRIPVKTILELGSGGGNNASHMKSKFTLTLTDLSEEMLTISRRLNPECEHVQGDMRNLCLGSRFDAVFVHDAVSYLTTQKDLKSALDTAFIHCKPGGSVIFCPDYIKETFGESNEHGGHSKCNRGLRYLSWTWDPDPSDTEYYAEFAYLLKENEKFSVSYDHHVMGVFSRDTWLRLMKDAGFVNLKTVNYPDNIETEAPTPVFAARKP
jgi:trans-aconitate methyltransferase